MKEICEEFAKTYSNEILHSNASDSKDLLHKLDNIPWISYIIDEDQSGLNILLSAQDKNQKLIEFAKKIAEKGYDGKTSKVDHAIASGLMLLKYTSVWYWIFEKAKKDHPDLYEELNSSYRYPKEVFKKHVIPACRAVVYHNMVDFPCEFTNEPLLYFAILCDELQMWDRFWSGTEKIENWKNAKHCMAEEIYAEITCNELGENQLHLTLSKDQYHKLSETIKNRLQDSDEFIKLTQSDDV